MAQPPKPTIIDAPYLFSVAKEFSNAARAHEQRRKYVDSVLPLIGPQRSFNFWGEDFFLGRIGYNGEVRRKDCICPRETHLCGKKVLYYEIEQFVHHTNTKQPKSDKNIYLD